MLPSRHGEVRSENRSTRLRAVRGYRERFAVCQFARLSDGKRKRFVLRPAPTERVPAADDVCVRHRGRQRQRTRLLLPPRRRQKLRRTLPAADDDDIIRRRLCFQVGERGSVRGGGAAVDGGGSPGPDAVGRSHRGRHRRHDPAVPAVANAAIGRRRPEASSSALLRRRPGRGTAAAGTDLGYSRSVRRPRRTSPGLRPTAQHRPAHAHLN